MTSKMLKKSESQFLEEIEEKGYSVIEGVVPPNLVARMKTDLIGAIEQETKYHKSRNYPDFGMVLFCPLYSDSFIELLECDDFMAPVESAIGKHSILYSYTSTSMPPSEGNYSSRIHNDCHHTIPDGYITKFQTLIALDDFTLENGATYILPGSHKIATEPTKDEFYKHAERLTMKAGSVWYAHAKIWHAGGTNTTDKWRHAVTSVFCRSYMKQRLDIPRLLAGREATLSQVALQKLGFLAQVPISYDEYYAPPEQRKFRQPLD